MRLSATSRFSSSSRATRTSPRPPLAKGRRTWKRKARVSGVTSIEPRVAHESCGVGDPGIRARLACRSGSSRRLNASRTEAAGQTSARLLSTSLWLVARCWRTSASTRASASGVRSPRSLRIWPRGFSLARTQAFIASTRASWLMRPISSARVPNSRLRSADSLLMEASLLAKGVTGQFQPHLLKLLVQGVQVEPSDTVRLPSGDDHFTTRFAQGQGLYRPADFVKTQQFSPGRAFPEMDLLSRAHQDGVVGGKGQIGDRRAGGYALFRFKPRHAPQLNLSTIG